MSQCKIFMTVMICSMTKSIYLYLKINIDISEDMKLKYLILPILLSNIVNGVNLIQNTLLQQVCDERGKKK